MNKIVKKTSVFLFLSILAISKSYSGDCVKTEKCEVQFVEGQSKDDCRAVDPAAGESTSSNTRLMQVPKMCGETYMFQERTCGKKMAYSTWCGDHDPNDPAE